MTLVGNYANILYENYIKYLKAIINILSKYIIYNKKI